MTSKIWMWIVGGMRSLVFLFDGIVYGFVIDLYNIFRWMCGARIVDNTVMNELATRVGFILGLVMFFYISFDFIQILLDPDKLTDKDKGPLNIIKKFLVVIVLLGTSRYIFDLMYSFQNIVLSSDENGYSVIEKLLLPYDIKTENFGTSIATNFMMQFYKVNDRYAATAEEAAKGTINDIDLDDDDYSYGGCFNQTQLFYQDLANSGNFDYGDICLNQKVEENYDGTKVRYWFIDFSLLSLPVGLFIGWMLIMYCISVGMRVIQLVVLQVISPAAIICYLSPKKENTFTKWLKLYFSTYIDVFIRIAIIDFIVLLSGLVIEYNNLSSDSGVATTDGMKFWIMVFMIMALLSFAKKAPDLIKKLLPESLQSSGLGFGISAKERPGFGMVTKAARRTAGYGIGTVGGGLVNGVAGAVDRAIMARKFGQKGWGAALSGLGSGALRGFRQGFQNKGNFMKNIPAGFKAQHESDLKYEELVASGGTAHGMVASKISSYFGETKGQAYQRVLNNADQMDKFKENMHAAADEVKEVQSLKNAAKEATQFSGESAENFRRRQVLMNQNYRKARRAMEELATGAGDGSYKTTEIEYEEIMKEIEVNSSMIGKDGKPIKIKKMVGTGEYKAKLDANGNYVTKEVEHKIDVGAFDDDDVRWKERLNTIVKEAEAYRKSHNVKLYDVNGNEIPLGEIENSSDIGKYSDGANETRTYINSRPDYPSSQAEDQAAGVKRGGNGH